MQRELQQSVMDVAGKNGGVISATLATVSSGLANSFEIIQPIIGGSTSLLALVITYVLFRKRDKLLEKEIELRDAQIKAIGTRKEDKE
ncbi:MAG: hypothetical protein KAR40_13960 [Candidatus Sabulitectum sp.]|nr:hypothetical protein [Candidatus Sabulitectum sp.]